MDTQFDVVDTEVTPLTLDELALVGGGDSTAFNLYEQQARPGSHGRPH
jgi:hypothetical protein